MSNERLEPLVDYYRKESDRRFEEILEYAQFMGYLQSILTYGDLTSEERVKRAIEHLEAFNERKNRALDS
jgi:hypothetical protein